MVLSRIEFVNEVKWEGVENEGVSGWGGLVIIFFFYKILLVFFDDEVIVLVLGRDFNFWFVWGFFCCLM